MTPLTGNEEIESG